ncbi:putative ammonium transporter 3 [Oppia nitens]|uniref:putative ammonium transporter 3 n=1 Tax=Oppia nitens TaxID=1686743 RepID=UPI0023DC0421|nr:putative ammonium transporter 3 [Oppia nitens]
MSSSPAISSGSSSIDNTTVPPSPSPTTGSDRFGSSNDSNDVCWILTSAFLIFTMQTGYALLESGVVSRKNEANILVKNAVNIMFGSLAFWLFGYGLSFGTPANQLVGYGDFMVTASELDMGPKYSEMAFQLAYSTTSTAIISGSMSERCKFVSYLLFSSVNTFIYCVPARWLLREGGWLRSMGAVDIGGSGTVHLVGGCSSIVAAILLGPRIGRFGANSSGDIPMGNPTNCLMGLFMLWWGWLGFSAGSTFGITGDKWKFSSRASVTTILASMGGGSVGMVLSYWLKHGLQDITMLMDSILGSLVAISGGAPIFRPGFSVLVGSVAAFLVLSVSPVMARLRIDDPTNSFAVHAVGGAWGLIAIGLFAEKDNLINYTNGTNGLLINWDTRLIASQLLAIAALSTWSILSTLAILLAIKYTVGLRMSVRDEILGPDFVDHGLELSATGSHKLFG